MEKLEAVQKVLRFSAPIREWCEGDYSVYFDDFDEQNVDDYDSGGYGDLADKIIERGIEENLLEKDEVEWLLPATIKFPATLFSGRPKILINLKITI